VCERETESERERGGGERERDKETEREDDDVIWRFYLQGSNQGFHSTQPIELPVGRA